MGVTAAQLVAQVSVQGAQESKQQLQDMGQAVEKTSGGFKSMLGNALSFAAGQAIFNLVGGAIGFLKDQTVDAIRAAIDHQQIMTQTVQALKSTKDASGETAGAIGNLAESLSQVTPFSEDAIQQTENLELTFTNIGKSVFPQATQAILDVSQAMHQDLQSSAIQVGKALGDPLTGMTALQRIGVTFTAQEKEQIKTMMAHNDVIGAQKIILHELSTEFGGSAEAAGKTFGGALDILKNKLEDVKIKVGTAVLPILSDLVSFVSNNIFPVFDKIGGLFQYVGNIIHSINLAPFRQAWDALSGAVSQLFSPLSQVGGLFKTVGTDADPIANIIGNIVRGGLDVLTGLLRGAADAIRGLGQAFSGSGIAGFLSSLYQGFQQAQQIVGGQLQANFKTFTDIIKDLGKWWQTTMQPAIAQAAPAFERLGGIIANVAPSFAKVWAGGQQVTREVMPPLIKAFETIAPIVVKVGGFLADNLGQALKFIMPFAIQAAGALASFAGEIISRVIPIVQNIWGIIQGFLDWIKPYWPAIWDGVKTSLQSVWDVIKGVIQIAWSVVSNILKIGLDLLSGNWKKVWDDIKALFSGVWEGIKSIAQGIWIQISGPIMAGVHGFQNTWNSVWSGVQSTFTSVWNSLSGIAQGAWNSVGGAIKSGINWVIGLINDFIGGIDRIGIDVGPVHVHPNIPQIPYLASGIENFAGGLAYVHRDELLVNMPAGTSVIPASKSGANGGGQPIIVRAVLEIDGRLMSLALLPHMSNAIRHGTGIWGV